MLLPVTMLLRRGEWAALIGRALELKAAGLGQHPIAAAVGVCRSTVRGWLSRFAAVADEIRVHLVRWALWLVPRLSSLDGWSEKLPSRGGSVRTTWRWTSWQSSRAVDRAAGGGI